MRVISHVTIAVAAIAGAAILPHAHARPCSSSASWSNSSGGGWWDSLNWTPSTSVPGATTAVNFSLANTYTVTFNRNTSACIMDVADGEVVFNLNNHILSVDDALVSGIYQSLLVGGFGEEATLIVNPGTMRVREAWVARDEGDGYLVLNGQGVHFKVGYAGSDSGLLRIGPWSDSTVGVVEVKDGAQLLATNIVVGAAPYPVSSLPQSLTLDGRSTAFAREAVNVPCSSCYENATIKLKGSSDGDPVLQAIEGVFLNRGGSLTGGGYVRANLTNNKGGTIEPGGTAIAENTGRIEVIGDYLQGVTSTYPGTLKLHLKSAAQSGYDRLIVTGAATLGGTLTVEKNFSPTTGTQFTILNAVGGVSGSFATTNLPSLDYCQQFKIRYCADRVVLYVVTSVIGDADLDGDVDSNDLDLITNNLGATGCVLAGDVDFDGDVDSNDLALATSHLYEDCNSYDN